MSMSESPSDDAKMVVDVVPVGQRQQVEAFVGEAAAQPLAAVATPFEGRFPLWKGAAPI
jgi:hypothetical protein